MLDLLSRDHVVQSCLICLPVYQQTTAYQLRQSLPHTSHHNTQITRFDFLAQV